MNMLELMKARCSVRSYAPKKVEPEKLNQILLAAQAAPTAANRQPVRLMVLQDQEALDRLSKGAEIYHAPLAILVLSDRNRAWKRPFDGKQTTDIDAAILTDHMMLEAASLGLGSVWICYFRPDVIRREFSLPDHLEPVNILALGYPAAPLSSPERHKTERLPLSELVYRSL